MSSAAADLTSRVCFLEFVTKAPKFTGSDKLVGRSLRSTKYCSVVCDLNIDGECFKSISGGARVNER